MIEVLPEWESVRSRAPSAPAHATGSRASARTREGAGERGRRLTLGDFSAALARAGILDNRVVDLPGSVVAPPDGVELLNLFRERVHSIYRAHGLQEYEYPLLAPTASLLPVSELLDLDGMLLYASEEPGAGSADVVLSPTGEATIYSHWAKIVRSRRDLPIRMYRRARYFRPVSRGRHAGRGVFYAMEHDDIFEFHCAYGSSEELGEELPRHWTLLQDVVRALHVPALWSTRPPWTNRHEVADWALAADVPLPVLATTQVSVLYKQATRFSRAFRVGFREDGQLHNTWQLCGYVSRRLLLVHLLLGMRPSGRLFVHPELAPAQVELFASAEPASGSDLAESTVRRLAEGGIRARLSIVGQNRRVGPARDACIQRGTPVVATVVGSDKDGRPPRVVLLRSDCEQELELAGAGAEELAGRCAELLAEIGDAWDRRAARYVDGRVAELADADSARQALAERLVVVCPMALEPDAVRQADGWGAGEVLGFARAGESRPCVVTGRPARTVALISPRM